VHTGIRWLFPQFGGAGRNRCSAIADGVGRLGETPLVDRVHRPSRRVSDVQDIDRVLAHAIENPEWITHNGYDTDPRSLRDSRSRFRDAANAVDDIFQPSPDGISYRGACAGRVIGRNPIEISERSSRIDKLHAWRNLANTVLISPSVAVSPASMEAMAASMIRNSSWVA
jgi:hypothetical protein